LRYYGLRVRREAFDLQVLGQQLGIGEVLGQGVPPDSLRAALRDVFARPEYRWSERPDPWGWIVGVWYPLLDWLDTVQRGHTAGFEAVRAVLARVHVGLLAHLGYVVWQSTGPSAPPP